MVYPIHTSSKQALQNAVFDYLNFNRHKFDQYGNFDLRPDKRDFVPLQLARWNRAGPPNRTSEFDPLIQPRRQPEAQSAGELRRQIFTTMTEEDEERQELHKQMADRGELTEEKCREEWEKEIERCDQRWDGRNQAACKARAADRLRDCRQNRRYTVKEWGWEDLDMPEIEKEEFRKRFGKPNSPKYEGDFDLGEPAAPADARSYEQRTSERNPYIFEAPWGSPIIYRAPLMPPELQRKIRWNLGVHIPPEEMMRILLTVLSRGRAPRGTAVRGEATPLLERLLPAAKGATQ